MDNGFASILVQGKKWAEQTEQSVECVRLHYFKDFIERAFKKKKFLVSKLNKF